MNANQANVVFCYLPLFIPVGLNISLVSGKLKSIDVYKHFCECIGTILLLMSYLSESGSWAGKYEISHTGLYFILQYIHGVRRHAFGEQEKGL